MTTAVQFGQLLRNARQLRGLSPEQLAGETSVPLAHLEALEAGQLHTLPGGLYLRAEARAYAEGVALDPKLVLGALTDALASNAAVSSSVSDAPMTSADATASIKLADGARIAQTPLVSPISAAPIAWAKAPHGYWNFAVMLLLGGAALLFEPSDRKSATPTDLPVIVAADVRLDTQKLLDGVARIAEPSPASLLPRTLFASNTEKSGPWVLEGRLNPGRLIVQSSPAGARVTVNGIGWGVTPVTIRYLPFGTMRLRLVKDNHRSAERLVDLSPDTPTSTVRVTLPPIPGRVNVVTAKTGPMLVVNTTPPGARLTVNGIGWGMTPVAIPHLPFGLQRLRVVKEQFISEERVVQVVEGQSRSVSIALRRDQ